MNPDSTFRVELGEQAEKGGNLESAARWYSLAGQEPRPLLQLARVLYKQKRWQDCLDAYTQALSASPHSEEDAATLRHTTICAVACLYELGYLNEARQNCPTLRLLFPGDDVVENLCKTIEAPWTRDDDPRGCGRKCVTVTWRAPWDEAVPPPPREHCTRKISPHPRGTPALYSCSPVQLHGAPTGPHPIVVMTSPRPEPTLPATLASLLEAGSARWPWTKMIASDGPMTTEVPNDWLTFCSETRSGSGRTFVRALETALHFCPDLEYLTVTEDDIEACQNFLDYLRIVEVPVDLSMLTWFTYEYPGELAAHEDAKRRGWRHPRSHQRPVLATRSIKNYTLSQCVTLTRAAVLDILACPRVQDWHQENAHDEMPTWALGDASYAVHYPILVQHVGGLNSAVVANRSLHPTGRDPQTGERMSPDYVGRTFDALSLLPQLATCSTDKR